MKKYSNIRRAVNLLRRNDGVVNVPVVELLKWVPYLEEIDVVLGKMSRPDFNMFVGCEGEDYASKLSRTLPIEWASTKKTQNQWRKSLRLADKFLNLGY